MDAEKIKEYLTKLEKGRAELIKELLKEETPEDFGAGVGHSDEEVDEAENFGYRLAEAQTTKDRINEIDIALNKIRVSRYGVCEECGKEIERSVLDVVPESRLCQNCKSKKKND